MQAYACWVLSKAVKMLIMIITLEVPVETPAPPACTPESNPEDASSSTMGHT
jgi:hypothetical protein